jgi:single-strand DNA-binding protein
MNKVIMMGRLCKDPDVSSTASGKTIARYSVAVDRKFKREGEPEADFFNLVSFDKQGQFVEKHLKKGTKIVFSGRIETGSYINKEGQKVFTTTIYPDDVEFAESKGQQAGNTEVRNNDVTDFLNVAPEILEELPFS